MFDPRLIDYALFVLLLTLTPGVDTMLVIRNVLAHGRRAGLLTTAGICCGTLVHGLLSGLGLSLILVQSAEIYAAVKLVGAAYLVFLGLQSLWSVFKPTHHTEKNELTPNAPAKTAQRAFVEGLFTNVLNPKVAVFYLALLPQYIDPVRDPVLAKSVLMAGMHFVMGALWLSLISAFVGQMRATLTRPSFRRVLEGTAGALMVGFGVRLAFERD
jgi:RhtB (resistance to homoserine/threonine) family protein